MILICPITGDVHSDHFNLLIWGTGGEKHWFVVLLIYVFTG